MVSLGSPRSTASHQAACAASTLPRTNSRWPRLMACCKRKPLGPGRTFASESQFGVEVAGRSSQGMAPDEAALGEAVPGDAVPGDAVPGDAVPGDAVPGDGAAAGGVASRGAAARGAATGGAAAGATVAGDVRGGTGVGLAAAGGDGGAACGAATVAPRALRSARELKIALAVTSGRSAATPAAQATPISFVRDQRSKGLGSWSATRLSGAGGTVSWVVAKASLDRAARDCGDPTWAGGLASSARLSLATSGDRVVTGAWASIAWDCDGEVGSSANSGACTSVGESSSASRSASTSAGRCTASWVSANAESGGAEAGASSAVLASAGSTRTVDGMASKAAVLASAGSTRTVGGEASS